jgi:hypothetical protein
VRPCQTAHITIGCDFSYMNASRCSVPQPGRCFRWRAHWFQSEPELPRDLERLFPRDEEVSELCPSVAQLN